MGTLCGLTLRTTTNMSPRKDRSERALERCPTHPGAVLREIVLPSVPTSKTQIARALGISRQTLHDILAERKPITPAVAIRIAAYLHNSPEMWLRMQLAYDLWHAKRLVDVSKIEALQVE